MQNGDLAQQSFHWHCGFFFASRSIHLEKPDILVPGVTSIVVTRCLLCQEPVACFQRSINDVGQWFPHTALDGAAIISFISYIWGFPAT